MAERHAASRFMERARNYIDIRYRVLKAHLRFALRSLMRQKQHGLPSPLTLSLTSYPKRFSTLHLTLKTLLSQTMVCDQIILWIAEQDLEYLPDNVRRLEQSGLLILTTRDIGSYKKIIPTLRAFPNHHIITVDDDLYYPSRLVEELVNTQSANPGCVAANRTHQVTTQGDGKIARYVDWNWLAYDNAKPARNFMTGAGGVIYPPGCFHSDILDESLFMAIAPRADDIWLFWMLKLNNVSVVNTGFAVGEASWPGSQASALWHENVKMQGEGNDAPITRLIQKYGQMRWLQ